MSWIISHAISAVKSETPQSDGHSVRGIAKYLGVSRATLYRYLDDAAGSRS